MKIPNNKQILDSRASDYDRKCHDLDVALGELARVKLEAEQLRSRVQALELDQEPKLLRAAGQGQDATARQCAKLACWWCGREDEPEDGRHGEFECSAVAIRQAYPSAFEEARKS